MINTQLAKKITKMAEIDQKMRQEASKGRPRNSEVDQQNTIKLKQIVSKFGWPTVSLVGEKASQSAWLLVQHADHDVEFQKTCLQLMESAYSSNVKEINPKNIAYLTDRILVAEGKEQLFGTQFYTNNEGKMVPRPMAEKANLNKRRLEMVLGLFE